MKRFLIRSLLFTLIVVAAHPAHSQAPGPSVAQMKRLDFWIGEWKGDGWIEMIPGQRHTFVQTESVQPKLGGVLLLIEGLGKRKAMPGESEAVSHNALAVVSYDGVSKTYRFRSYIMQGHSLETEAKVGDKRVEWSMPGPGGGTIRYTITLNDKGQWFEIGERSADGKVWTRFFEMTLQRVK